MIILLILIYLFERHIFPCQTINEFGIKINLTKLVLEKSSHHLVSLPPFYMFESILYFNYSKKFLHHGFTVKMILPQNCIY